MITDDGPGMAGKRGAADSSILPNALLTLVWFVLVGRKLYQLGRPEAEMPHKQA